jgi:uncharacterized membrane protein
MKWLRAGLLVAYPFAIYLALQWLEPRTLALGFGALVALRAVLRSRRPIAAEMRQLLRPLALVAGVIAVTFAWNDGRALLFVPAGVNLALLVAFARTLRNGPPVIETFARLQHPDLTPAEVRHCRRFTAIWCVFFVANAAACIALALRGDLAWWTLYTGLLSYGLIGLLLAVEFVVRSWRFGRTEGSFVDPVFRRIRSKAGRDA